MGKARVGFVGGLQSATLISSQDRAASASSTSGLDTIALDARLGLPASIILTLGEAGFVRLPDGNSFSLTLGAQAGLILLVKEFDGAKVTTSAPASSGGGTGLDVSRIADQPLSGHRVVRATSGGGCDYADAATQAHAAVIIGITTGAVAAAGSADILVSGEIEEPSWTWTPGPVYCGSFGVLTQTPPTSGFVIRVGLAEGPTTLLVEIGPAILLA